MSDELILNHRVSIGGTVKEEGSNHPLEKVKVEIIAGPAAFMEIIETLSRDPKWKRQLYRRDRTFTRADGMYFFLDLPAGTYTLRFSQARHRPVEINTIKVEEQKGVNLSLTDAVLNVL